MNNTDKSALMRKLEEKTKDADPSSNITDKTDFYILDAMFFFRTLPPLPQSFGGVARVVLERSCSYADTVHTVCVTDMTSHLV